MKLAILLVLLLCVENSNANMDQFLRAIRMVESSGRMNPPDGDQGRSIGPFQISKAYWLDACKQDPSLKRGSFQDCRKYEYAKRVVAAYLTRYGLTALQRRDWKTLARIHNGGGPQGAKINATLPYWEKVRKYLPK